MLPVTLPVRQSILGLLMGPATPQSLIVNIQISYVDFCFLNVTATHENLQYSCIRVSGNK